MEYTPQHVANFMLERGEADGIPITPLKLVKLVYIASGWQLALIGEPLFEESIEAWKHGPVVPSIYHEFKHFKSSPITEKSSDFDLDSLEFTTPRIPSNDGTTNLILSKVWAAYKRFSAWDLRNKTHESGGPWSKVYKPNEPNITLNSGDIQEHYKQRIAEYIDAAKDKA